MTPAAQYHEISGDSPSRVGGTTTDPAQRCSTGVVKKSQCQKNCDMMSNVGWAEGAAGELQSCQENCNLQNVESRMGRGSARRTVISRMSRVGWGSLRTAKLLAEVGVVWTLKSRVAPASTNRRSWVKRVIAPPGLRNSPPACSDHVRVCFLGLELT